MHKMRDVRNNEMSNLWYSQYQFYCATSFISISCPVRLHVGLLVSDVYLVKYCILSNSPTFTIYFCHNEWRSQQYLSNRWRSQHCFWRVTCCKQMTHAPVQFELQLVNTYSGTQNMLLLDTTGLGDAIPRLKTWWVNVANVSLIDILCF